MPRWPGPWPPPPESLRCGGLPAGYDDGEPADAAAYDEAIRDQAGELRALRGRDEDGSPRVAALDASGTVFRGRAKVMPCECGEHEHGTVAGTRAAADCAARTSHQRRPIVSGPAGKTTGRKTRKGTPKGSPAPSGRPRDDTAGGSTDVDR